MKILTGIMSKESKTQYMESIRRRYSGRGRAGRSRLLDEVCDTLGLSRKHAIKALNGRVSTGGQGLRKGPPVRYEEAEKAVVVAIWRCAEMPCGKRLKAALPLWLGSYEARHGTLPLAVRERILECSARQLDRLTALHRATEVKRHGRLRGRTSHRLKKAVPVRCGPWDVDRPGWLESDTVSHGGGSSSGDFLHSLTMTDICSGWTELAAIWNNGGHAVKCAVEEIRERLPFDILGFDCDNGSEFLNHHLERYFGQLAAARKPVAWTRSRAYKKNDQAHVEQKNFTHVRQLLGYGRFDDELLVAVVNRLYRDAWLPLHNHFCPVMKLVEKQREGSKVRKRYDSPATPCDRLLANPHVSESTKAELRGERAGFNPFELAEAVEQGLVVVFDLLETILQKRAASELEIEDLPTGGAAKFLAGGCVAALVAGAPKASTSPPAKNELNSTSIRPKNNQRRVS